MHHFMFPEPIRSHLQKLIEVMDWANMQDSDNTENGIAMLAGHHFYGPISKALFFAVSELIGSSLGILVSGDVDWGCQTGKLDISDVEFRISTAMDELVFCERITKEKVMSDVNPICKKQIADLWNSYDLTRLIFHKD